MKREILIWPDPRLKLKSKRVTTFDASFQALCDDLFETMYAAKAEYTEGCLSVPGEYEDTGVRASSITCKALDRHGKPFELSADGLLAIAIQHEMDHLEGVLFVDYLSSLKRGMIKKRMQRLIEDRQGEAEAVIEAPARKKRPATARP
jgi:peptide deformylase